MPRERRLTEESLTDSRDQRHWKDGSSSRKGIWYKPKATKKDAKGRMTEGEGTFRILPQLERRGLNEVYQWYYLQKQIFIDRVSSEGNPFRAGITLWTFMREEQPKAFRELIANTQWTEEDARDFFTEIPAHFGEEHIGLPKGGFGKSVFNPKLSCNCVVLKEEDEYSGEEGRITMVYPMPWGVMQAIEKKRQKQAQYWGALIEPIEGPDDTLCNHLIDVSYSQGAGYSIDFHPQPSPIWYEQWETEMPSLEEISPNFMSYDDQKAHAMQAWPQLFDGDELKDPDVLKEEIEALQKPVEPVGDEAPAAAKEKPKSEKKRAAPRASRKSASNAASSVKVNK